MIGERDLSLFVLRAIPLSSKNTTRSLNYVICLYLLLLLFDCCLVVFAIGIVSLSLFVYNAGTLKDHKIEVHKTNCNICNNKMAF